MKFSKEIRIMQLEHRIAMLSIHEMQNYGIIQKAKRELRRLKEDQVN